MGSQENAEFGQYLLQHFQPIPPNYYTDSVFKHPFFDRILVRASKISLYLFNNYINASLQSKDTATRRELFHNFMQDKRQVESNNQAKTTTSSQYPRESSLIEFTNKPPAPAEAHKRPLELSLPKRNNAAYHALNVFQVLVFAHYALAIWELSDKSNKKLAITCSRTLETIQTLVKVREEPVRIEGTTTTTATNLTNCYAHLESYIFERYDKFNIWNMSEPRDPSSLFYTLFNDWLLVEEHQALQLFADEVRLFCHTIGTCFITSGVLGSLLAELVPYDIAPFVFIFDPQYSAHYIKSRILSYHNLIRKSYKNYWSIYDIKQQHSSITVANYQSPSSSSSSSSSPKPRLRRISRASCNRRDSPHCGVSLSVAPLEHHSNYMNNTTGRSLIATTGRDESTYDFGSYIPSARCPELRKMLLVILPLFHLITTIGATCAFIALYIIFTSGNFEAVDRNHELKAFLDEGIEPAGFNRTIATNCGEGADFDKTKAQLGNLIRRNMIDQLANTLFSLSTTSKSNLQTGGANDSVDDSELEFNADSMNSDNESFLLNKRLVVNSIMPTKSLHLINWSVPFLGASMTGLLIALYFSIFLGVLNDLCFWLFEIRMKLDICSILLKLYGGQTTDEELQIVLAVSGQDGNWKELPGADTFSDSESSVAIVLNNENNSKYFGCLAKFMFAMGDEDDQDHDKDHDKVNETTGKQNPNRMDHCNVGTWHVIRYIISNSRIREKMCHSYAYKIYARDNGRDGRHYSDSFLVSAYLDFRLFLEQIDMCRKTIDVILSYGVIHALNIIASSHYTEYMRSKIGFMAVGYALANFFLLGSAFFQSQCMKLISPIYSMLALSCNDTDKTIRHLSALWHRSLIDLVGSRTKLSFRVYSMTITYTTVLEFNLAVTSLYILTLDKSRYYRG